MNLKPLLLYFTLTLFSFVYAQAQCDGSFLETIIFECDAPFDMDNRTTFGFIPGTWSGGSYIDSDGVFTPTGLAPGDYNITFTTSSPPCNPFTTFVVTVAATPEVLLTQNTFEMCENAAPLDLTTFEDATTTPGFWDGPGVTNNTTFNPSGLSGEIEVSFIAFCDIDDPTSCTPPFIPNPVCGCDDTFYNSACEAELAGVTTYTPWIPNFPPSCPANSGCEPDEKIFTINVLPSTTATLTASNVQLCDGDSPIDLNDFVAPSSDSGTWNVSNIFDPSTTGIGNYFFEFSTGSTDCDDSETINIVVEESLDVILTQASLIACSEDGLVNLNDFVAANSDTGTWSGPGVNSATGIFNISAAGVDTHTLSYGTGFDVCDDNATFVIVVNESMEVILTTDAITICSTDSFVDLSEYVDLASDAGTWSGIGVSEGFFNPAAGNQVLTYATEPGSCDSSSELTVTVVPTPDAILNTSEAETCFSNGIIDLSQYVDVSSDEGIWAGQGVTSLTSEFDVNAGSQSITFTAFSGDCEDVETLSIIVHPSPVAALTEENLSFLQHCHNG